MTFNQSLFKQRLMCCLKFLLDKTSSYFPTPPPSSRDLIKGLVYFLCLAKNSKFLLYNLHFGVFTYEDEQTIDIVSTI